MLIRREADADAGAIAAVTTAAFSAPGGSEPVETRLVAALRAGDAWLPALSLVAVDPAGGDIAGHVVCTRGHVGSLPASAWARSACGPSASGAESGRP